MKIVNVRAVIALACLLLLASAAEYSCPETCRVPDCVCPSADPPGGLDVNETPQLVVLYMDEIVTEDMFRRIVDLTTKHQNLNGCDIPVTWYMRSARSDPSMIRNAFNRYFEIAVSAAAEGGHIDKQIADAKSWLVSTASIPVSAIVGYRAPKWSNAIGTRSILADHGFVYDHSIKEVSADPSRRLWPYSMANGIAQDCDDPAVMCDARERHPGVVEIPVWELRDRHNRPAPNVTAASAPGEEVFSNDDWLAVLSYNFGASYYGNRAPVSIPLSSTALLNSDDNMAALSKFLGHILEFDDVWVVTNAQLVSFMTTPKDKRHVHELFECGGRSSTTSDCFPPNGGCARGTYDYAACTCECENAHNPAEPGFCIDSFRRCTIEKVFYVDVGEYQCLIEEPEPVPPPARYGVPLTVWLVLLFVVLAFLAAFGLWRGLRIGRRKAEILAGDGVDDLDLDGL
ncbi:EGF-like domain-containing protein [Plasmodiophora brassicae]|uniref:EGF-like domain-containing protein n=1 Tax=Plasmodiophora brassicae TaxID=37360 RepID=A0A0G4IRS2_PLABS|nr:hypothetical protein PBRA_006006 [Plasmodiophora brassicae]SPQ98108.1 unnamed protein product [Plasmodiophora brassicae]